MNYRIVYSSELYHHGIKGQKWGVRRFQNEDGTYTDAGKERYFGTSKKTQGSAEETVSISSSGASSGSSDDGFKLTDEQKKALKIGLAVTGAVVVGYAAYKVMDSEVLSSGYTKIGKENADTILKEGTEFFRVQSEDHYNVEHPFYSTYEKHDVDKYVGLFGTKLKNEGSGALPYQVKLAATENLVIPSQKNTRQIVGDLVKDDGFRNGLLKSVQDAAGPKGTFKRPSQQILLREAERLLKRNPDTLSKTDKKVITDALNLTLVNHSTNDNNVQNTFYTALKNKGYSALLDLNDKSYSSYHAKSPVIIFDTNKVQLQSVTGLSANTIDSLNKTYSIDRYGRDIPEQVFGTVDKYASMKIGQASDYVENAVKKTFKMTT